MWLMGTLYRETQNPIDACVGRGYGPHLLSHSLATFGGTLSPSMICVMGGGHDKDGNFGGGAESCTIVSPCMICVMGCGPS